MNIIKVEICFYLYFLWYTIYIGCGVMDSQFNFKKSLGQNFLIDKNIIHKIVDNANIDKNTLIIEIGPGGGALTQEIVPICGYAILYEADARLESQLIEKLNDYSNFSLIIDDFLKRDLKKDLINYSYHSLYVVANLPYYITTPIIMKFIDEEVFPDKMVVMVQKEVADRLSAKVGSRDYGSLTVFLNYYFDIKKLFDVSRNCFVPRPNVDSSIVMLDLKKDRLMLKDGDLFKKIVKDSFSYKRKTIRNNLKKYDLDIIEEVLKEYGYDLTVRAEQLDLTIFVHLANRLSL